MISDLALDLCSLSNRSCLNNGTCVVNPLTSTAICNCSSPSYAGSRCEVGMIDVFVYNVDLLFFIKIFLPCLVSPCQNNGICLPGPNGTALCNCTNCYSGSVCQNIDYCCLNVCTSNGLCIPGLNNTYTCICSPNFTGIECEKWSFFSL